VACFGRSVWLPTEDSGDYPAVRTGPAKTGYTGIS
jgi:hypothetical protein